MKYLDSSKPFQQEKSNQAGLSTREDIKEVHEEEKLQGVIHLNSEPRFRLEQLYSGGFISPDSGLPDLVVEVSYAKWGKAPSGQMADGLRIVVKNIMEQRERFKRDIILTAYIIDDVRGTNEASAHVLEACGFKEVGKIRYDLDALENDRLFILRV